MKKMYAHFSQALLGVLGKKAFDDVNGRKSLTMTDKAKLKELGFTDSFIEGFVAHLGSEDGADAEVSPTAMAVMAATVSEITTRHQAVSAELAELKASTEKDKADHQAAIQAKETEIAALREQIQQLSKMPEQDPGRAAGQKTAAGETVFDLANDKQFGGMQGEYNSMDRAYNKRARAAMMAAQGMEATAPMASATDFESLKDDLGAFYRTRWSDRLQSFLTKLPDIFGLFPMEAGHQHLDTLVNLWVGEFSQSDTSGKSDFDKVVKGDFSFGTETLRMYDVMFAYKFRSLKDLERSWIGYLNREGSNPVKLSFIEFLLVEVAKALHNEQQRRFINGVHQPGKVNEPGTAMGAADGLYEYIRKRVDGYVDFTTDGGTSGKTVYQIKPFELGEITEGNIGELIYRGTSMIPAELRDSGSVVLYMPSFMLPWYHKYNEARYGQNTDYKGGINYVKEFPSVTIKPVPNADNHHRLIWTLDGNIKTFCQATGEMLKFTIEQSKWEVTVYSNWKESIQAQMVGRKYTDRAEMDGSQQVIWCNEYDRPAGYFVNADRDKNPSVLLHNRVATVANSKLLTVTDIDGAKPGQPIYLKCGAGGDQGVTIAKSGKFALIKEAWTPSKGDVIMLMQRADGKFIELNRFEAVNTVRMFEADSTTPDVKGATVFSTGINTQATAITDLLNAVQGQVYTIYGTGKADKASTISSGDNFDLTDEMVLTQGKYIRLAKGDKFYEIERG